MTEQIQDHKISPTKLTKTVVENLGITGERYAVFDESLKGFAVRVGAKGEKSFYLVYRAGRGRGAAKKWLRLGAFPSMSVEQARQLAKEKAADVIKGADPAAEVREGKNAPLLKEVIEKYFAEHVVPKRKAGTRLMYRVLIDKHITPKLGKLKVADVEYRHVAKLHHEMAGTPYQANRMVAALNAFFKWCGKYGYYPREKNPCSGIDKFPEVKKEEFLKEADLTAIGVALTLLEANWHAKKKPAITPPVAAALRLLVLTGARHMEILSLRWEYINTEEGTATLPDSKTGHKVLQLNSAALAVLETLPQISPWVFPSDSSRGHMVSLKNSWPDVVKEAGLHGRWRVHDLRHAFASVMVNSGASLPVVGKILGHAQASTTARYAHVAENPARKAAEEAAAKITAAWNKAPADTGVIPFRPRKAAGK